MFFLSVIIPVYNAEKYLEQCLSSLSIDQNSDVQVILVNDGSVDDSGNICKNFKDHYPDQVVYISKENAGVSAARNDGIKEAAGKYVVFLDADDFAADHYIEKLREITDEPADLYLYEYNKINPMGEVQEICHTESGIIDFTVNCPDNLFEWFGYQVWNKVFLKRIIQEHQIEFDCSMHWSEDMDFWCRYCLYADRVISVDQILYNYRLNENGAVASVNPMALENHHRAYKNQLFLLHAKQAGKKALRLLLQLYIEHLTQTIYLCYKKGVPIKTLKNMLLKLEIPYEMNDKPFKSSARIKENLLRRNNIGLIVLYFKVISWIKK